MRADSPDLDAFEVLDRTAWEALEAELPEPHLLQGWDWGELKSRWGWAVERRAWRDAEGRTRAIAQLLHRRVGRSPFRVGYCPKGPILRDALDPRLWNAVLRDLERWARDRGLHHLKMDADVPADALEVAALWRERGWSPSDDQIQFPNTMVSRLDEGEEALLGAMKSKTRYNLRLAERRAVSVRERGLDALDDFLELYAETGARGGFGLRSRAYYRDLVAAYLERDRTAVLVAEKDGRPLAAVVPIVHHRTAWYLYGASTEAGRRDMPAYLVQWESLRWAMARGCTRYDWWGGPTQESPEDPLWGVYRFKSGFGAELVRQQGAWDFPSRPLGQKAFEAASRARRWWLARRA